MTNEPGTSSLHHSPNRPAGWLSANQLRQRYRGSGEHLRVLLGQLRLALIDDLSAAGYSEQEAINIVENNLVGWSAKHEGKATLAVSPEVVRLLGLSPKSDPLERKPEGWFGVNDLIAVYRGNNPSLRRKMENLQKKLIGDIMVAWDCTEAIAAALVENHLIGHKSRPEGGPIALAVSPEVLRFAEADRLITRRHPVPGNSCNGRAFA